ncbi:MAG: hypothetical protein R3327_06145 [Nitrosopumilaceae archaeon]|nr:hypothetical protein [Nitrosopumilaceae archaeon]
MITCRRTIFMMTIASAIVLLSTNGFDAYAESIPESDSVGDIHIRAIFDMSNVTFENNSFKIFNQVSGYKDLDKVKYEKAIFTTAGAPGMENMWLYHAADVQHRGYQTAMDPAKDFKVTIEMYQGETVFRSFKYTDCVISNYYVSTLHDGEETFMGKTKFVYADNFEFTCSGVSLDCPFHSTVFPSAEKADNESTIDRTSKERSTWSDLFRYRG